MRGGVTGCMVKASCWTSLRALRGRALGVGRIPEAASLRFWHPAYTLVPLRSLFLGVLEDEAWREDEGWLARGRGVVGGRNWIDLNGTALLR